MISTDLILLETILLIPPWEKNHSLTKIFIQKLTILQCFVFIEKNVHSLLPFLENNIYKVLNIYQMIQICQGFQPSFISFMKSLLGHISNTLTHEKLTGEDFSTFFTWPLGHKSLCVSI